MAGRGFPQHILISLGRLAFMSSEQAAISQASNCTGGSHWDRFWPVQRECLSTGACLVMEAESLWSLGSPSSGLGSNSVPLEGLLWGWEAALEVHEEL